MSVNNNDRNLDEENQFVSSTSSRVEPNCQHDFERIASSKNEGTFNLSEREQEVLNLLVQGQANKDIAATLYVCEKTVEFHLTNLYAKLNV